jgi:cytochrome c-type protein NapC
MLELVPGPWISVAATLVGVLLALRFVVRPARTRQAGGALVAVVAFVAVPGLLLTVGAERHLALSKSTAFCLSCHEMHPYGASLLQPDRLAHAHWAGRFVPREAACYTCHTEYTLYGGLRAKLKGLQHLWVHFFGAQPDPIALYTPYSNRECLHCHEGAKSFEEAEGHLDQLEAFRAGTKTCMKCHGPSHGVEKGAVSAAIAGTQQFQLPATTAGGK